MNLAHFMANNNPGPWVIVAIKKGYEQARQEIERLKKLHAYAKKISKEKE